MTADIHAPENRTILEEALQVFTRGDWRYLGITGERELRLTGRIRNYVARGENVPSHLLFQAARVWEENRQRILTEWLEEMDKVEVPDGTCNTCPACGCPGMN